MRRTIRSVVALGVVGAGVALMPAAALAAAPLEQGWWTVTNPGDPVAVAPPSDVPADGLLVQGGATSPTAYAGLVYDLDPGQQPRQLVLKVASGSAKTPDAGLQVCPLKGTSLNAEQGGPMADAPAYDCTSVAKADPSADGTTYTFDVPDLAQGSTLAVAVLPTGATDRIVLAKPDASSLLVSEGPSPVLSAPPLSDVATATPPPQSVAPPVPLQPGAVPAPVSTTVTGPVVAGPAPSVSLAPEAPAVATTLAAASHTNGKKPVLTIVLVAALALAAALWMIAGGRRDQDLLDLPA